MKKTLMISLMLLVCIILYSCNSFGYLPILNDLFNSRKINNGDWSYGMVNGYEICHINSRNIVCGKVQSEYSISIVIDRYITEFCYNDCYVAVKCVDVPEDLSMEIDKSKPDYFIINTITDEVYGAFTEAVFLEELININVSGLCEWISTVPAPEGVTYSKEFREDWLNKNGKSMTHNI